MKRTLTHGSHGLKYRLYYGLENGTRLVRYDNDVHDDLQLLKRAGLIEEDEQGAFVRYDKIHAEIDLAA